MHNTADRKSIRNAEKEAKRLENERGGFVRSMMQTIHGRMYVHNQLERSHIFSTSFAPDPLTMAFKEGERNQGLQLFNDVMTYCPDEYVTMMREANERSISRNYSPAADRSSAAEYSGGEGSGRDVEGSDLDPTGPIGLDYDPYGADGED